MEIERVRLLRRDSSGGGGSGFSSRSPHRLSWWRCRVATVVPTATMRRRLRLALYAVGVASAIAAFVAIVPIKKVLQAVSAWIDAHPVGGVLLLPVLFCVAIPLAIPATVLEIASGSVFGVLQGALLNAVGKTCGSLVAFLVGKRLGKQRLGSYLQTKFPVFTALSRVVEGPNWKPLLLLQLSSLPPVVKCYGLSITDVGMVRFTLTSFVGGLPSALLWASIGYQTKDALLHAASSTADGTNASAGSRWLMLLVGIVCTVLAMGFLFVYTRRELRAQLQHAKRTKKLRTASDDEDAEAGAGVGTGDDDDDEQATASEETSQAGDGDDDRDAYEIVVTQVAVTDTEQQVAKRTSMV